MKTTGGMPLQTVRDELLKELPDIDVICSQIGLLPNLFYASQTLRKTEEYVSRHGDLLNQCLRAVPGPRLDPEPLSRQLLEAAAWIENQAWADSRVTNAISRIRRENKASTDSSGDESPDVHPLKGYSLSVAHHSANLFYAHEEQSDTVAQSRFENLLGEFSMFVIAAQAQIEPAAYVRYCQQWWHKGSLPDLEIFPNRRLASRVAGASRALRRLSRCEHKELFAVLSSHPDTPLPQRVYVAEQKDWGESDPLIGAIGRLIQVTLPGWHRYRASGSGGGQKASQRANRSKFKDGFIRLPDSLSIENRLVTDDGIEYSTVVERPPSIDEYIESQIAAAEDEDDASPDTSLSDEERKTLVEKRKCEARERAKHELDGQEWLPADESAEGEAITFVTNPGDESAQDTRRKTGIHPVSTSRFAADHRRRQLFAHTCTPDRALHNTLANVIANMLTISSDEGQAPLFLALHAVIALGRSWDELTKIEIMRGRDPNQCNDKGPSYLIGRRSWVIPVTPPANTDKPPTKSGHPHCPKLMLPDVTGFYSLLLHFRLQDKTGFLINQMTENRRQTLNYWLTHQLKATEETSRNLRLENHLRHRLLMVSRGDVGVVSLITGRTFAHGSSVGHYSHYPPSHIRKLFRLAWDPEVQRPPKPPNKPKRHTARINKRPGHGALRVPSILEVQSAIRHLQIELKKAEGARRRNYYTAYTWAGLTLGVGMRPVTNPIIYTPAFGVADGAILTFIEKARTDYHRRVNVMPGSLTEHLRRYANAARGWQPAESWNQQDRIILSWIEESGDEREFRPSDFELLVKPVYDLELYSFRRFMRTQLSLDGGLSGEDIDVFMGHWFDGVSPFDRLSTYSFRRQQAVASHAVRRILEAVGFSPRWIDQKRA